MSELTKVSCRPVNDKFTVCYIRFNGLTKSDLNLIPSKGSIRNGPLRICDSRIRSNITSLYEEFNASKLTLEEYFQLNIIEAKSDRRKDEFTLRGTTFVEGRQVINFDIRLAPEVVSVWRQRECYRYGNLIFRRSYYFVIVIPNTIWMQILQN